MPIKEKKKDRSAGLRFSPVSTTKTTRNGNELSICLATLVFKIGTVGMELWRGVLGAEAFTVRFSLYVF